MKKTAITMFALALALGAQAQPSYINTTTKVSLNLTGYYQNPETSTVTAYNNSAEINKTVTKLTATAFKISNADIYSAYSTSAKDGAYLKVATILDVTPDADATADAKGIYLYKVGENPILIFTIANTTSVDKGSITEIGTAPVSADEASSTNTVVYSFVESASGYTQGTLTISADAATTLNLSDTTVVNGAGTYSDSQSYIVKKGKVTSNAKSSTTKLSTTGNGVVTVSDVDHSFVITGGSVVATETLVK